MGMNKLPKVANVAQAIELGQSSHNVMTYLRDHLLDSLQKERAVGDYTDVIQAVDETKKMAQLREEFLATISSGCWHGTASSQSVAMFKPNSVTHVDGQAIEGIQELNQELGKDNELSDIVMAYYIDDNAQFNRGYIVNQEIVDDSNPQHQKILEVVDKIFHSWLISNGMLADEHGVIHIKDKNGDLTQKAKREDIARLLEDPDKGLRNTVEKIDPNIQLSMLWSPPEEASHPEIGAGA